MQKTMLTRRNGIMFLPVVTISYSLLIITAKAHDTASSYLEAVSDQDVSFNQIKKNNEEPFHNDTVVRRDDPCYSCSKLHRGVLHRVKDPVHAVLYCNSLELYRGKNKFDVNALTTPILLTPGSNLCFTVKMVGNLNPEILCAENLNCRDEWWKALTRAILCTHHGTEMRHEIAGEPVVEEEEELVSENVIDTPESGGINIKFSGITDMPIVKLKKIRRFVGL